MERIEILKDLFINRTDAYGLETISGAITVREPLTDSLIQDHLEGRKRIGSFIVSKDDKVKVACVDLDEDNKNKHSKIIVKLIETGFYPYSEKSRNNRFHTWVFFDEPIEAVAVRKVLLPLMKKTGIEVEVFPKQDSIQPYGLGNYVFLPLFGGSVKENLTVFVDNQGNPYPDQWSHLAKIHKTKSENILALAERKPEGPNQQGSLDVSKYLIHFNIPFKTKQQDSRIFYLLNKCLFSDNHTKPDNEGDSSIVQGADGKLGYQCFHKHCKQKVWGDARKKISEDEPLTKFLKGYTETKTGRGTKERNLSEDFKLYIEGAYGTFTTSQVYNDLDIRTPTDKTFIRVNLHRLVQRGEIERGLSNGTFRKTDRETDIISIEDRISKPLPLKWPAGLEDYVKIMRKTTVGVAGTMQAGKTAFLLNVAWLNKDLMPTNYFTSEFGGDELRERLEPFGYPMEKWRGITFIERSRDFQDVINPDGLNLIDYLEVSDEGEYFKMGIQIKRIYEKLHDGVAVIGLQKKLGSDFGYGGPPTADKPRLYITLEKSTLKIVKAKLWKGDTNPNGMFRTFKLHKGATFTWNRWEFI